MKQKLRKPVAWLLTMAMVLGMIPDLGLTALASESDNLCLHHTEHTADCGYAEAAEARPCTHTHDESCGFTEGAEVVPCACEATDENGAIVHTEGCGYVAAIPAADCTHEHDDTCGYAEAVMAHECHYICTECLADAVTEGEDTTEPSAEIEDAAECTCDSDDPDWHAPFCALYEMPEEPECFCTELCDPELPNEWCDVCYFDADACAGSDEIEAVGYATTPTYIASLGIAQDAHEGDAKGELSGHTVIDYDLNKGCGSSSDYIYMGYKTTTDPGNAITGIFIRTGENPPASATFDGVTAYLVGGSYEANTAVDNVVDLNEDAGGAYIYVYVTRDTSRAPVTEITFSSSGSKSGYTTPNVDLNQGVGGSDDIYLHYKQFSATVNATYHYLTSTGSRTSSSQSGTVKHHEEKMTKVPSVSSTITYNGKSYAFKGWREDNTAAAASTTSPSVTYMTTPKTYRAVYSRTLTLRYDANGGTGAPTAQTATQYLNAGSSSVSEQSNSFTLSKTAPTHAGKCRFLGWSKNSDAASASYTAGSSISLSTDTTLYAVYQQEHSYTNGECVCGANIHSYDAKGFCACTAGETHYQPAVLKNGYYQIGNAGQLFWFANYINTVDRTANAILTDDIDLENRPWTPIGSTGESSNNFRGHFDGDGHTIKGLYVDVDRAGAGFFGEVRTGTVENFTIYGEVVANTEVDYVGGVIGSACGLNSSDHGLERNGAIIRNITSYVNLTAGAHGVGKIGGFVGYANHESLIENCAWYGTFDAGIYRVDNGAGGFIGRIQENSSEVTIRNCGAYGTIKTNYAKNSYNNNATIYMGGFLSFSNTNAQTTLENCLFAGRFERGENLTDQAFLGAFGTLRSVKAIKNCYYRGDDGLEAVHSDSLLKPGDNIEITSVTGEELRNNTIATQLGDLWEQDVHYPALKEGQTWHGDSATYTYTDNGDGTHKKTCNECGYVETSRPHTFIDNACICSAISLHIDSVTVAGWVEAEEIINAGWAMEVTEEALELLSSDSPGIIPEGELHGSADQHQCIGISVTNENNHPLYQADNDAWYHDGNGWFSDATAPICDSNTVFSAYYPYFSLDSYLIPWHIDECELLYGTATDSTESLTLERRQARLVLTPTFGSEILNYDIINEICINGVYTEGTFNGITGTLTPGGEPNGTISMKKNDDGIWETGLIPMDAKTVTLTIRTNENKYYITTVELPAVEAGKQYNMTVQVGADILDLEGVDDPYRWSIEENLLGYTEIPAAPSKTEWANGDTVTLILKDANGELNYKPTITYQDGMWSFDGKLYDYSDTDYVSTAIYAVNGEYAEGKIGISGGYVNVHFNNPDYSRLRILGTANTTYNIDVTGFTPADGIEAPESYTLITDADGNAFLYGTFGYGATVTVKLGDETVTDYIFVDDTSAGYSYVLCVNHTGGTANCTEQAECEVCGASYGELEPNNHASENYTCTDNGDGTHTKVHECGVVVGEPEPHTIENHVCTDCGAMEIVFSFDAGDYEWKTGDQIKIERTIGYDTEYYTYTASVDENGYTIWIPDKKLYWDGKEEHILAAFYPAAGQDDYRSFELPEDQSTLEKLKSADCMNAVWVGKPTTDLINFQMKHRLSMITIDYDFASEFTNATIEYAQVIPSDPFVMFDAKDGGKMDEPYGVFGTTIDAYHDAVNKTIQAIVIPCTYPEGQLFMKISVNGEELQVKMPEAKTFDEGTHYTFDLKVGKDKVTLTQVSTSNDFPGGWDKEENLN